MTFGLQVKAVVGIVVAETKKYVEKDVVHTYVVAEEDTSAYVK